MADSYNQHFQNIVDGDGRTPYLKHHYDVTGFCNRRIDSLFGNIIGRVRNSLIKGINEQVLLPKAILVVLDNNVLDEMNHYRAGAADYAERIISYLMNQFHRIISAHKEKLPSRSRKFKYPTIFWVQLPLHRGFRDRNDYREQFNLALQAATATFREMQVLRVFSWDYSDDELMIPPRKFTNKGLSTYWHGIDRAFEVWDRDQMKSQLERPSNNGTSHRHSQQLYADQKSSPRSSQQSRQLYASEKFHSQPWHCENLARRERRWSFDDSRFKLPKPPM